MSARLKAHAPKVAKLKKRIFSLEIQNYDLRESNAKLKQEIRQLQCPK